MADQTKKQVADSLNMALVADEQEAPVQVLFAGVTQEQLDEWKAKYKEVHIITVKLNEHESLTGYFKKPGVMLWQTALTWHRIKRSMRPGSFCWSTLS